MHERTIRVAAMALALAGGAATARAGFLDLTTLTTGTAGSFAGSLDGTPVTGAITASNGYSFTATGTSFDTSTINGTSPQYSYSSVYSPTAALTDRVGYAALPGATNASGTVVISFGAPVVNPRFHVANLDGATYTFALTGGLSSVSLVSGNGGGGDGLQVVGATLSDTNATTIIGVDPATTPPTTGARSAYGTVSLNGTISVLTLTVSASSGDGGSFTLSSVPEPGVLALIGISGLALRRRR